MYTIQVPLVPFKDYLLADTTDRLVLVLSALDLDPLLRRLGEGRRGPGRRGMPRVLVQALIAGWVYDLHSIAELRRELLRNGSLRMLVGLHSAGSVPSEDAFGRCIARLARNVDAIEALFAATVVKLRQHLPELGRHLAVDATAVDAWSDGNRKLPADPDAAWGKRGVTSKGRLGFWFGYKLHLAVDTVAELPLAYTVTPANLADSSQMAPLLETVDAQQPPGHLRAVMADAAYDSGDLHSEIWQRRAAPIIDHNHRGWLPPPGYTDDGCPCCGCGLRLRFLGRDREYVKYHLGEGCICRDAPTYWRWRIDDDVRLHPPVPRHAPTWKKLYAERTSVERVNSRLKEHLRLRTVRHRGMAKVRVHVGLTLLVMVAGSLAMLKTGRPQWARSVARMVA